MCHFWQHNPRNSTRTPRSHSGDDWLFEKCGLFSALNFQLDTYNLLIAIPVQLRPIWDTSRCFVLNLTQNRHIRGHACNFRSPAMARGSSSSSSNFFFQILYLSRNDWSNEFNTFWFSLPWNDKALHRSGLVLISCQLVNLSPKSCWMSSGTAKLVCDRATFCIKHICNCD